MILLAIWVLILSASFLWILLALVRAIREQRAIVFSPLIALVALAFAEAEREWIMTPEHSG